MSEEFAKYKKSRLESASVEIGEKGAITVEQSSSTTQENIYASATALIAYN